MREMSEEALTRKFGCPPLSPEETIPYIILQLCISFAIIFTVRPPFICKNDQTLNLMLLLLVSLASAAVCQCAYMTKASPSDIFKGIVEVARHTRG
jgi:hypothetical protein